MKIFIIVYLIGLCCYFHTRTSGNKTLRAANKYLLAGMYLGLALVTFFRKHDFVSYQSLLMAALLLAFLGDVFLVFDFGRGGDFFLAGNICFSLYERIILVKNGHTIKETWWVLAAAFILALAFNLACRFKPAVFRLGKMRGLITFYLTSTFLHGFHGLGVLLLVKETGSFLLGLGSFLFMISDMILMGNKFVFGENKWLIRANSLTYFTGLLLIVLSMTI